MVSNRSWIVPLAAACALSACDPPDDETAASPEATIQVAQPTLPSVEPPIDRRALLLAVAESASAYAAGRADQQAQRDLQGRRFEIRLRFGCPGDDMGSRSVALDPKGRTLRFRIDPDVSIGDGLIGGLNLTGIESVQGFSVERPWMLQAGCPSPTQSGGTPVGEVLESGRDDRSHASADPTSIPLVAIAQAFTEQDPRTHLGHDRSLTATYQLGDGEAADTSGYDLVLSGRLARRTDGRVIACHAERPDIRPRCAVWADLDSVSLVSVRGNVIADWSGG